MFPTYSISDVVSKSWGFAFTSSSWQSIKQNVSIVFSSLRQQVTKMMPPEEPFFLKAQRESYFQRYQAWCSEIRQAERQLITQLKNKTIHPARFRKVLLALQQEPELTMVSPVYYQQRLTALDEKIRALQLPPIFSDGIQEAKARFRQILQTQPETSERYFYDDVINRLIELAGRQLSPENWLEPLGYYQDLVPENIYHQILTTLRHFLESHQEVLSISDNLYDKRSIPASNYAALLADINAIFISENRSSKEAEEKDVNCTSIINFTPRLLAVAAIAAAGIMTYGYREWLTSQIHYSTETWVNEMRGTLWQTMEGVGLSNMQPWTILAQATVSYGFYQQRLLPFHPMLWSAIITLSVPATHAQIASTMTFGSQFNVSDLNGNNGFVVKSVNGPDRFGSSISSGDINGDGITDLLIGAPCNIDGFWCSQSYVVFGSRNPFPVSFNLKKLNGANGFMINGFRGNAQFVSSISSGDINGDGIADLLIGTFDITLLDQSYVIYGSKSPFPSTFSLTSLNGINGFATNGVKVTGTARPSISSGDINGDGIADMLIGIPFANSEDAQGYVIYGSKSPFPATFNLTSLNGINGFAVNRIYDDPVGISSIASGDINDDGVADLLIDCSSQSYVVFGSRSPFPASFNLTSLNGANGFTINGDGDSINSGDINGDGITDLLIGATYSNHVHNMPAQSYVVFGSKSPFPASFNLTSLNGANGFTVKGFNAAQILGASISSGDINGDGITDLLIGAPYFNYYDNPPSQSYIVYGSRSPFPASFNLTSLNGANGFTINGNYALFGSSISSGDINGDGVADLLIGEPGAQLTRPGCSYVLFGENRNLVTSSGFKTELIIIISLAGSWALATCIGATALWVYRKRKNQSASPESQPLLGTADFRRYDTLELSSKQAEAAAQLEQELREAFETEQSDEFQLIAERVLVSSEKSQHQPKDPSSRVSNPSLAKIYQTPAAKQTFFYADIKAEQRNELLNLDSPSDDPSQVTDSKAVRTLV